MQSQLRYFSHKNIPGDVLVTNISKLGLVYNTNRVSVQKVTFISDLTSLLTSVIYRPSRSVSTALRLPFTSSHGLGRATGHIHLAQWSAPTTRGQKEASRNIYKPMLLITKSFLKASYSLGQPLARGKSRQRWLKTSSAADFPTMPSLHLATSTTGSRRGEQRKKA